MAALPNAAKIGFTGTPIMREGKKKTESIFGPFIDKYTNHNIRCIQERIYSKVGRMPEHITVMS